MNPISEIGRRQPLLAPSSVSIPTASHPPPMDYSAVTDGQQQQQQQQQYQQYQQPYDPSHAQSYDAYYASYYNQQQQQQQQQYDPSAYQYYPTNYSAAAAAAYPAPPPPDPAATQIHAPQQHGYQTARPEQHVAAAVAAFSQLTEFAGTAAAAERARQWHPPLPHQYPPHPPPPFHVMQHDGPRSPVGGISVFRGGGRRGGRRGGGPYGGGRGNFGHHPSGQDGSPSSSHFRGRGRGRIGRGRGRGGDGGRQPKQSPPDTQLPHATPVQVAGSSSVSEPSAVKSPVQPRVAFFPVAWCDICRVDCNSVDILEQHKNGKRHKKTVQRLEKMQQQQSLMAKLHPTSSVKAEIGPPKVEEHKASSMGEPEKTPIASETMPANLVTAEMGQVPVASDYMLTPPLTTEKNMDPEMQNQTVEGQSEITKADLTGKAPANPTSSDAPKVEAPPIDGNVNSRMGGSDRFDRGRGGKRKMWTIGRGGKRLRYNEPVQVRKPIERLKVREQPRYCTVCNVMCDTLAVFERHLSGKKHTARLKRIQVPGTVFGPVPVYIPPNQPAASQGPEPVCYGLQSQDILQHEAYGLNSLQVESFGRQQHGRPQRAREADSTTAAVIQADQVSEHPKEEVPSANVGEDSVVMELEVKDPRQAPISLGTGTAMLESVVTIPEEVPPFPEYIALVADIVVMPGLDIKIEGSTANNDVKMEGPSANNEELAS